MSEPRKIIQIITQHREGLDDLLIGLCNDGTVVEFKNNRWSPLPKFIFTDK